MGLAHGKTPGCDVPRDSAEDKEIGGSSLRQLPVALLRQCVLPAGLRTRPQRHGAPCRCLRTIKSAFAGVNGALTPELLR
ncbi:hypothetical protein XarjCFBP1022_14410 [Xanthomonas arboricola]|nr:hypothetical protein XarbCFBP8147_19420 [Xanthomonas arboricola]PPU10668.1 hypothetical protein XarjCFBP1022_14410 [Xanthomonas arboricola]